MSFINFYKKRKLVFTLLLWSLFGLEAYTQDTNKALNKQIMVMDSLLFDVAFNQCDLSLYKKIISENIEFYDDRSGLNSSIEKEIASFQDKCAKPYRITRKLVDTAIYVLGDFGAVQHGTHIFLVDDKVVEKAKFTTIWEFTANRWVVKRAISYDHQPME